MAQYCSVPKTTHIDIRMVRPGLSENFLFAGSMQRDGYADKRNAFIGMFENDLMSCKAHLNLSDY